MEGLNRCKGGYPYIVSILQRPGDIRVFGDVATRSDRCRLMGTLEFVRVNPKGRFSPVECVAEPSMSCANLKDSREDERASCKRKLGSL